MVVEVVLHEANPLAAHLVARARAPGAGIELAYALRGADHRFQGPASDLAIGGRQRLETGLELEATDAAATGSGR